MRAALNLSIDAHRWQPAHGEEVDLDEAVLVDPQPDAGATVLGRERLAGLALCLARLTDRTREIFITHPSALSPSTAISAVLADRNQVLDHRDQPRRLRVERAGKLDEGRQSWLPLASLEHADVVPLQLCLEPELFLRQAGLLAQVAQNTPEDHRKFQQSLQLWLEKLDRLGTISSANHSWNSHRARGVRRVGRLCRFDGHASERVPLPPRGMEVIAEARS